MNNQIRAYKGDRFPKAVISHTVWIYHRFSLSYREGEELLAGRGVEVSYEAIRKWRIEFPSTYAKKLRKSAGQVGDIWHLDEFSSAFAANSFHPLKGVIKVKLKKTSHR